MNLPEFRLYYDDTGQVLFYTCDKIDGNYIVIDSESYFQSRFDIKIIDGKMVSIYNRQIVTKLVPSEDSGIACHPKDISIIYNGKDAKKWRVKIDEHN